MPVLLQNIVRFILLVVVQVLILNNIQFSGFVNPYVYILFILSLPVQLNRHYVLILSFLLGLLIDVFSNTMGMHAFACVFIGFFRTYIIRLFIAIEEGNNPSPGIKTFGMGAYVKYLIAMVLIHHIVLFFIESFSFHDLWITLLRIIISSAITVLLLLGFQSINAK